jgi:site-specific DNA recombinase
MKKAIGYVRVSTEKQVSEGVSIDAQVERIKAWALINDYELVEVYFDEGISGATFSKREGINKALANVEKGMAFVCYSLSRVSRHLEDTLMIGKIIQNAGADLVSLTEQIDTTTASGKMIFNLFGVLNQFERDQVAERTRTAMQFLKANNKAYTHPPYGFDRRGDDFVENEAEKRVIELMLELRQKGYGHRKIATHLNKNAIYAKNGGLWHPKTVKGVLDRIEGVKTE